MSQQKGRPHKPDDPDFVLDDYPLYNLNRTAATYTEAMSRVLKSLGMDQPQWRVLMLLGDQNPSSVGALSRRSVTKMSTITRILIRMEKEDLVQRLPSPDDNRVIQVFLRPRGRQYLKKLRIVAGTLYDNAFVGISDEQLENFQEVLKTIRENLALDR